jgi:hypothetical protein
MDEGRIPTEMWVSAQLRGLAVRNMPAYLVRRGEAMGGMVLVKLIDSARQCRVFTQSRDFDGNSGWLPAQDGALVDEAAADAYIGRAVARDPDIWVIEVETRDGAMPFEGKIF